MQHFLAGVEAVLARGFRTSGQGAQGLTTRAGFHQLGPVQGHAVLPVGTGAFVARDLRRPGVWRGAVEAFGGAGGTQVAPRRSTLAYDNEHRPWELYQTVFEQTLCKCQELVQSQGGRQKFRFKNKLMSLDGSVIDLSVSMFDWAKFRRTKGAIKLHLLLDHDGYLPSFAVVTEGKTSEIKVARTLRFAPGTILAVDRGYIDYEWFRELTQEEVYFVTRMKENAVYEVKEELEIPQNSNVVRDQII